MSPRSAFVTAVSALAVGLGACGGEPEPLSPELGSDPVALRAVQAGPEESDVTVHWLGRNCPEIGAEENEGSRRISITLNLSRDVRCSGPRSGQSIGLPLEQGIEGRQIVDGRTKEVLVLSTCRDPGEVPNAIKRSICRVERRARQGE